jgi:hypothetical protein
LLSLFRINDPYRLILVLLVLVVLKLPFMLGEMPQLLPELNWMLVGEKMSESNTLYTEIWEDIAPLSAAVYWMIDEFFGRSSLAYQLIALVIVFIQSIIFSTILLRNKAYDENTYLPAIIYAILMQWSVDFYTLSPPLMSLTFVLIALNNILYHVDQRPDDRTVLTTGLYIGIAALFYLPSIFFLVVVLFSYLFFTGTRVRRQLLFFYGLALPLALCVAYYFSKNGLAAFSTSVIYATFTLGSKSFVNIQSFLLIALIPVIFFLITLGKIFQEARLTTYQSRYQQLMILMFLTAIFTWIWASQRSTFLLVFLVPTITFFLTRFFLMVRRRWLGELLFIGMTVLILAANYGLTFGLLPTQEIVSLEKLFAQETPWDKEVENKRILILGENLNIYRNAQHATPYLDWRLSKLHLERPQYYDNLTAIYKHFEQDPPQVIIDPEERFEQLFNYLPTIKAKYEQGSRKNIYILK